MDRMILEENESAGGKEAMERLEEYATRWIGFLDVNLSQTQTQTPYEPQKAQEETRQIILVVVLFGFQDLCWF